MKAVVRTPLHQVRAKEESEQAKDAQLQALGFSLAQEKAKNVQKDVMIQQMGQQIAQLRAEIILLKGAVN